VQQQTERAEERNIRFFHACKRRALSPTSAWMCYKKAMSTTVASMSTGKRVTTCEKQSSYVEGVAVGTGHQREHAQFPRTRGVLKRDYVFAVMRGKRSWCVEKVAFGWRACLRNSWCTRSTSIHKGYQPTQQEVEERGMFNSGGKHNHDASGSSLREVSVFFAQWKRDLQVAQHAQHCTPTSQQQDKATILRRAREERAARKLQIQQTAAVAVIRVSLRLGQAAPAKYTELCVTQLAHKREPCCSPLPCCSASSPFQCHCQCRRRV
jgi:hypothetical protein